MGYPLDIFEASGDGEIETAFEDVADSLEGLGEEGEEDIGGLEVLVVTEEFFYDTETIVAQFVNFTLLFVVEPGVSDSLGESVVYLADIGVG